MPPKNSWFVDFCSRTWKVITVIASALAILIALLSFADRFATAKDLEELETKMVAGIQKLNEQMTIQFSVQRLSTLEDQERQVDLFLQRKPNDRELLETKQKIKKEKEETLKNILQQKR